MLSGGKIGKMACGEGFIVLIWLDISWQNVIFRENNGVNG